MILLLLQVVVGAFMLIQMSEVLEELGHEMQRLWDNRGTNTQFWNVLQQSVCLKCINTTKNCLTIHFYSSVAVVLTVLVTGEQTLFPIRAVTEMLPATWEVLSCRDVHWSPNDTFSYYGRLLSFVALGGAAIQVYIYE